MYLCCDLGGSTSDWSVYDPSSKKFVFRSASLNNNDFEDFYEAMDHLLAEYSRLSDGTEFTHTTLAVAGPTNQNLVKVTNIEGWEVNTNTVNAILADHGHKDNASIINDFEALGYGLLYLTEHGLSRDDFVEIHGRFKLGPARAGEARGTRSLVCGPGTGLGVSCVIEGLSKNGFPYIVSSEGGHHTLAPENAEQYRFVRKIETLMNKVSYEDVLSKQGLQLIYNYFRREDYSAEPAYEISSEKIIDLAISGKDQAAIDSIELFCEFLANFCGNTALTFNCDKAIYLWGGVLLKLPHELIKARFKRIYADRCKHSGRISRVPVILMTNPDLPLFGCAHYSTFQAQIAQADCE